MNECMKTKSPATCNIPPENIAKLYFIFRYFTLFLERPTSLFFFENIQPVDCVDVKMQKISCDSCNAKFRYPRFLQIIKYNMYNKSS